MLRPTHVSAAEAPEDLWRCHECGWTYPNHHPSAKHRRNHKKQCGKLPGFPISKDLTPGDSPSAYPALSPSYYASSDDEYLRSPLYAASGADDKNEHGDLSPTPSPVPGLELAGSGDQVSALQDIGEFSAETSPVASNFDQSRSIDISFQTDAENNSGLPDERSPEMPGTRSFRSARAEGSRWICRHCGCRYPNANPSAKQRRNHKKKCGAAPYAGTAGSSDEASSDDDRNHLKGKIPLDNKQSASPLEAELQASISPNGFNSTIPAAAAKDITSLTETTDESLNDETRPMKAERNLESEDKAILDPVSEQSQTTTAPDAQESSPLVAPGSNGLEQSCGASEEVRDVALKHRTDEEARIDNDDKIGSKHLEDSSELLKNGDLQAAVHEGNVAEVTGEYGALSEQKSQNDVNRGGGINEAAEAQELRNKFSTCEDRDDAPHDAQLPEPEASSRESIGIPGPGDSISGTPQPVDSDAAESTTKSFSVDAEQKNVALEWSGAGEDRVADVNAVDEPENLLQEPTAMSLGDSNHTVAKDERADEVQAEKVPDSTTSSDAPLPSGTEMINAVNETENLLQGPTVMSLGDSNQTVAKDERADKVQAEKVPGPTHSSEAPLPSGTEMVNPSTEPPVLAELQEGNPPDHFEGQVSPSSSKGRPESEKILSNGTSRESEKGLGIDSSDQGVVVGLTEKSPAALDNDSHELPAAVAGEEKLPELSEEQAPSPSESQVPDGMIDEKESSGAKSSELGLKGANHHRLAKQQEESREAKSLEDGDIHSGGKTNLKLKLDKKFEGFQVPVVGSASPLDRNAKPAAGGKSQTTPKSGGRKRAEVLQEALQSSDPGKVAESSSSPEGLVRARVQAFEKLAGAGGVDYQQRGKSYSPSKFSSPGTAVTPRSDGGGGGYQHHVQNNSGGQADRPNVHNKYKNSRNVHETPTEDLQEAVSHVGHGYSSEKPNSNGNAASAVTERDVPTSEAFRVRSHLRHSGKIF